MVKLKIFLAFFCKLIHKQNHYFFHIHNLKTKKKTIKSNQMKNNKTIKSLGGPTPYQPVDLDDEGPNDQTGNPFGTGNKKSKTNIPVSVNADQMKRARVLCAYDAKDHTELTLNANEVSILWVWEVLKW